MHGRTCELCTHDALHAATGRGPLRALITGVGGQDGSYLAELLLGHGYEVVGIVPRLDKEHENLAGVRDQVELLQVDLLDEAALGAVLRAHAPREVYNLASPSFVPMS